MIQIRCDGELHPLSEGTHSSLGAAIDACLSERLEQGRVLVRVSINGCEIPGDSLERLQAFPLEGIERIEIETRPSHELACESLASAAEYTRSVERAVRRTAELLREGSVQEANRLFADVLDALGVLLFSMAAAQRLLGARAQAITDLEQEVQPWLAALMEAQQHRDWLRVADCLEYELSPRLASWPARLREVHRACTEEAAP